MKVFGAILFGSQNGIDNICKRIARANRKNIDLTKNWYELFLQAEDAPTKGKNYIPDIRILEEVSKTPNQETSKESTAKKQVQNNNLNYLMITSFEKVKYENKNVIKIKFVDTSSNPEELFLMPEAKQDILKLKPGSIIVPISISRRNDGAILNDYKIVKSVSEEQKK